MRNHKRDGKITLIELLLIACIFFFGYWVIVAPMSKTDDMVKEEWVKNNLSAIFDVVDYINKDESFISKEITLNDVDALYANWKREPLEWPKGVLFDTFKAETNKVSIVVEFSTGTNQVTYVSSF